METKRILGAVLAVVMILVNYPQSVTASTFSAANPIAESITVCTNTPTSLTYEQLLELIAQAPYFTDTRSNITFADRRITETELTAWIAEYWGLGGMNSFELEVVRLINIERGNAGLPPLAIDPLLMMAARFHSQEMADLRYFNHRSPHHGRSTNRAEMFGHENIKEYVWGVRENISGSTRSPETVVNGWMNSPGHRGAILDADAIFLTIGIGAVQGGGTTAKFGA
jgi:uncharacterized protein YkwD